MYNKTSYFNANNNNYVSESFNISAWDLYGSSRLGTRNVDKSFDVIIIAGRSYNWLNNTVTNENIFPTQSISTKKYRLLGAKTFELTNHLGNVISTVSDRKLMVQDAQNIGYVHHYTAEILSIGEQYAFGMSMPGRTYSVEKYRYGMNTQEKDDDIFEGAFTAEFWEYDSRVGKRWNIDPLVYEWQSPYACFNNNPIYFADPNGLEGEKVNKGDGSKPAGTPLNKEGSVNSNGNGSVSGPVGETSGTTCIKCGSNGETTYGLPQGTEESTKPSESPRISNNAGESSKSNGSFHSGGLPKGSSLTNNIKVKADKIPRENKIKIFSNTPSIGSYLNEVFWFGGKHTGSQSIVNPWKNNANYTPSQFQKSMYSFVDKSPIIFTALTVTPFIAEFTVVYTPTATLYTRTAISILNEKSIEYYVIGNLRIMSAYKLSVEAIAGYIGKKYGWHILFHPTIQKILRSTDKQISPMQLLKQIERAIKRLDE
jgi:hypothetical protein